MDALNKETAITIAKKYCANYNHSPYSYMVVGKDDNKSPEYYVYEVFMNQNDQKAKKARIRKGEFLIKVYNQFKMAKLIKSKK